MAATDRVGVVRPSLTRRVAVEAPRESRRRAGQESPAEGEARQERGPQGSVTPHVPIALVRGRRARVSLLTAQVVGSLMLFPPCPTASDLASCAGSATSSSAHHRNRGGALHALAVRQVSGIPQLGYRICTVNVERLKV